ncbi:HNH endonuclease [Roseivivax sp. THAF197b]|uniref:HNH endonuclease n=1 Tax=Roseivivax sp. THAF197b TaxID=2588299 RepID=UPI00352ADF54
MGAYPPAQIDHRNGDRTDNRWINLRAAEKSENCRNVKSRTGSTSSYLGVSFRRDRNIWRAVIFTDGKQKFLGTYKSEEEAARAYDAAAIRHHGEFARLNFPP